MQPSAMRSETPAAGPQWSGVVGGCLFVVIILVGLIVLLMTVLRGSPDEAVGDTAAAQPAHSIAAVAVG